MTLDCAIKGFGFLSLIYADPGSGMLIWQLVTAAGLGLLFYAKTIIRKIRELLGTTDKEEIKSPPSNT